MNVNSYEDPIRFWKPWMVEDGDILKRDKSLCEHISLVIALEENDDCFEYIEQATIYCRVCEEEFTIYHKCN